MSFELFDVRFVWLISLQDFNKKYAGLIFCCNPVLLFRAKRVGVVGITTVSHKIEASEIYNVIFLKLFNRFTKRTY